MRIDLGISLTGSRAAPFPMARFMAAQEWGLWHDFTKYDRMFVDSLAAESVTIAGQKIGFIADQRLWGGATFAQEMAAQPDLVANPGPGFTATTGWGAYRTANSFPTLSVVAERLRLQVNADGTTSNGKGVAQLLATTIGDTYLMRAAASNIVGGNTWRVSTNSEGLASGEVFEQTGPSIQRAFDATATQLYGTYVVGGSTAGNRVDLDYMSIKHLRGRKTTQATASQCPLFQIDGAAFDGVDDNMLSTYKVNAGTNFLMPMTRIPSEISAMQVIAGAKGSSGGNCFIGVLPNGRLCGGVGNHDETTIFGTTDYRGQEIVAALAFDGSVVKLFAGTRAEYAGAQSGTPTESYPICFGAINAAGTPTNFYAGSIRKFAAGSTMLEGAVA